MSRVSYRRNTLPNGLVVLSERHPDARSVSIGIWVRVGTRHELPREAGLSHFLEHMLFKGTPSRTATEIAASIDRVGGELNAFTARECTCYHVVLLAEDLGLGMETLSDLLLNSEFDADELERERKVILQEITMVDESPEELVHDWFFEQIFSGAKARVGNLTGLGRPILGTVGSIRRQRRADLLRFFRTRYRPDQVVVSVAGRLKHSEVERLVRKHLGARRWPQRVPEAQIKKQLARERERARKRMDKLKSRVKPGLATGHDWIVRSTEQAHIVWGVPAPRYDTRDQLAAQLLSLHLGGGMSSLLFQEIREKKGLAYTVYSAMTPLKDAGVFSIYAAVQPTQVAQALRLIEDTVARLRRDKLTDEELAGLKANFKGTLLLAAESTESRMISLAKSELFYRKHLLAEEVCARIDQVSADELRRVARRLFSGDISTRAVLVVGPRPSPRVRRSLGFKVGR